MQWLECTVPGGNDPDGVCARLAEAGVGGMSVEDEAEFREFLANNQAYWDYVDKELEQRFAGVSRVKFWLPYDSEGKALLQTIRAAGFAPETRIIADEDWENNWKQYYRPIPIGEKLVVVPAWEEIPEGGRLPLRQRNAPPGPDRAEGDGPERVGTRRDPVFGSPYRGLPL